MYSHLSPVSSFQTIYVFPSPPSIFVQNSICISISPGIFVPNSICIPISPSIFVSNSICIPLSPSIFISNSICIPISPQYLHFKLYNMYSHLPQYLCSKFYMYSHIPQYLRFKLYMYFHLPQYLHFKLCMYSHLSPVSSFQARSRYQLLSSGIVSGLSFVDLLKTLVTFYLKNLASFDVSTCKCHG